MNNLTANITVDSGSDPPYLLGDYTGEVDRLTKQHAFIKAGMNDTLVIAPINLTQPNLRILDSATADVTLGLWLRDLSRHLEPPYELVASDITSELFPTEPPPNTVFVQHSIVEPWPASMQSYFNLTHQRFALAAVGQVPPEHAVRNLIETLAPGGWIQLVEMDLREPVLESVGPAMRDFYRAVRAVFDAGGAGHTFAQQLKGWMQAAGLEDVDQVILDIPFGNASSYTEIVKDSIDAIVDSASRLGNAAQALNASIEGSKFNGLADRVRTELETLGGAYRLFVVYGRRPW